MKHLIASTIILAAAFHALAQQAIEMTYTSTCHIFAGDKEICTITNGDYDSDIYKYYDAMGSVVGVYDSRSSRLQQYSYDAWGRARSVTDWNQYTKSYPAGIGYCGHEYIGLFELIDMRGRMYDPVIGRFISPDPYVQDPANSQNLNRYTYCLNNPLKYTDPTGELFIIDDFFIGMIKGIIKEKNFIKFGYTQAVNSTRIWAGLLATGAGRNFWTASLEIFSRLTYQMPQTMLGFLGAHIYNSLSNTGTVHVKYGAVVLPTKWMKGSSAMTLSNYIIGNYNTKADANNATFQHEYGHYLQSRKLGYLYLFKIGVPSLISASSDKNHKYKDYEIDASKKGHNFLKNRVKLLKWDYKNNPLTKDNSFNGFRSSNISDGAFDEDTEYEEEIYNW